MIHIINMTKRKIKKFIKQFQAIMAMIVLYIGTGSLFFHFVEDWYWLDSVYFSVVSLTTVGYGDVTPQTDAGKIFTMFYLIIGIGIFGAFINNVLKSQVAKRALKTYESHLTKTTEK